MKSVSWLAVCGKLVGTLLIDDFQPEINITELFDQVSEYCLPWYGDQSIFELIVKFFVQHMKSGVVIDFDLFSQEKESIEESIKIFIDLL